VDECKPLVDGLSAELRKRAELPAHVIKVRRCRLNPVFGSTGYDVLRVGSLTQCSCVIAL